MQTKGDSLNRDNAARKFILSILNFDPADRLLLIDFLSDFFRAGPPSVPWFGSMMAEARDWVRTASYSERKAYCAACYASLRPADQRAFLDYAQGEVAA